MLISVALFVLLDRICATSEDSNACQQVARNLEIACNYYLHNVDCMIGIDSNKAHIGRISGEEALLGANLVSDDVVVLGEIRNRHPSIQTVVIVKTSIPDNVVNLKGKKYCHPGFKHNDYHFSHLLLKELENAIIRQNSSFCTNDNTTLLEQQVSYIDDFFGDSCRPGPWSQNDDFDKFLQGKYSKLCNLCGSQQCNVDYLVPFNDSLKCLTDNDADVAVTTLSAAYGFFNKSQNRQNYKYFCKDGTSRSYISPCTWSTELPDLVIAQRNVADQMKTYLQTNLKSKVHNLVGSASQDTIEQSLIEILDLKRHENVALLTNSNYYKSLRAYANETRTVPTIDNSKLCNRTLNWCTYTDLEQEKCKWLSQAAMNWGIQPVVECKRSEGNDELSCLDDIKKNVADIVVASSDYAYISLKKGLKSIAYPETMTTNLSVILAVKKADNDKITNFSDLKNKRSCFPRYGGKEHLSFIDTVRKLKINDDKNCDYGELLSTFVSDSCVPGVRLSIIRESNEFVDKDKLCSLCEPINVTKTALYCNADSINKYYGSDGALKCLYDNVADFAVISKIDVPDRDNYQVICKNGSLSSTNGFNVDNNCALSVIPSSEVVSEISNVKNPDIVLALYEFEQWFGQNLKKSFHLFDTFNETLDLLFKDSTPGLTFRDDLEYINNYKKLLQNVNDCNSSGSMTKAAALFMTILFIVYHF